jgi:hypothetical protein
MVDERGGGATGFRYGVANVSPLRSEAVYRRDRFGQVRDMLEQRHDTTFFDDVQARDDSRNRKLTYGKLDAPINIIFVEPSSEKIVDPVQTTSQNLSLYSTSSVPYFDGEVRDRGDNPDTKVAVRIE